MIPPVLVLAPHPDDEVVGFATLIARRRAAGGQVAVLFLTEGIPAAETLWPWERRRRPARVARRQEEARAACRTLGAEIAGFLPIPSRRLKDEFTIARAAVERLAPAEMWVPAYEGGHQDHDTASFFAAGFARRGVTVREAPLYSFAGGRVRCQEFMASAEGTETVTLTPAEQEAKRHLLRLYGSEQGNLDYVGVAQEALRPQVPYDYTRPPHPGKTFYQRFQWVPFRHPRVDFTTPEEVCRVLAGIGG